MISLLVLGLAGLMARTSVVSSKTAVTVQAAGRGGLYFNMRDGRQMQVDYRGEQYVTEQLRSGAAQPRSLAAIDLDGDATPDLIAGYAANGVGVITVQHGNPDAFAPKDESVFPRMQQGYNPESLLPMADGYQVPERVDFLQVGDFNHDGRKDVLAAAIGGELFLLAGDGEGRFGTPEQIALPGSVTALASGEFRAADGTLDLAVGISGPDGPALLIYDGAAGSLSSEALRYQLPTQASAIEFGEVDSSPFMGVAVATGSEIEIIHGWGRKQNVDAQSQVERIALGSNVRGLASGFFIWNRAGSKQLAALLDDGTVHILQRGELDGRPFTDAEMFVRGQARSAQRRTQTDVEAQAGWQARNAEGWTTARQFVGGDPAAIDVAPQNLLMRGSVSFRQTDDLLLPNAKTNSLEIVGQIDARGKGLIQPLSTASDLTTVSLDLTGGPVAVVLPLPKKLNGERSLVVFQSQSASPTIVPLAPAATITVDRTDDVIAAACTGAANDCSLRGAAQFANGTPGTTISLPANLYILSIAGQGGCTKGGETNSNGDLELNADNTTITGAGSGTTIIRQIGTGNGTFPGDRVMCLNVPIALNIDYVFSGFTITGGRDTTALAQAVGGGGLVGGAKDNTLSLTDVRISNNQATGAGNFGGGGIQMTGGSVAVTNCTIGGTSAPGADRTNPLLANSEIQSGGGLAYSPGDPIGQIPSAGTLTITGTTFQLNTAASQAAGGGGADLFTHNQGTGSVSINTSSFLSNQATGAGNTGNGGGIVIESIATTVATTSLTSNTATNRGGGIYVGGGSLLLDGTTAGITFSGNTASIAGSSVSTASATNVSGTNTTIGGDIEVTTNGTWTNNAGSTLAPTNIVITGGTFTCNNSIMNVGGNMTLGPGVTVGGTFNGNTGTVNIAGNLTTNSGGAGPATSFNAGTNTFNFNGGGAQSISGTLSPTFNILTVNKGGGTLTLGVSTPIVSTLTVTAGIFDLVGFTANRTAAGGTLTVSNGATLKVGGGNSLPANFSTYSLGATSTVEYEGASPQTINAVNYGNLTSSGAGGRTLVNGSTTGIAGTFTPGTNVYTITGSTVDFNGGTAQTIPAFNFNNLTSSNVGARTLANSGTIGVAGTFTQGTNVYTITGSTVNFNGVGAQSIPQFNFNNLTISGAHGVNNVTLVNGGIIGVAGNFSPTATFAGGNYVVTNNTVDFNGTGAQSVGAPFNFNNLTISGNKGGAAITLAAGTIGIAGTFSPTATNNSYVTTGNTVNFNGSALQTIPAFSFGGLTLTNLANANLSGNVTVNGTLLLASGALGVGTNTLTLNGAASFGAGTLTSASTGTVNYNQGSNGQATVLAANYGNLTFSNFSKTLASSGTIGIAGAFTPGTGTGHTITGSTIDFNGAGTQTIPGFTYNNLTSSNGVAARTLDPVNTIFIAGVFTPGTNVYTITGSTIEYNGTSAQALPSGFTTYNNLTLNNTAGTTGFAGLTVNGLIEVKAGTFTSSSTYNNVQIDSGATLAATAASTINVSGNWTNNGGTFTPNTGTVNFNGGAGQTIGGTAASTFNNLTNSNPSGLSMSFNNTVNGVLALTSSDITVAATRTLTQPVGGTSSGGFDVNGQLQRNGFITGGAALSFGNPFNSIQVTAGTAPANIVVNLARSVPTGGQGFPTAVQRTYTITPSTTAFTATIRLHYLPAELNGNNPTALNLWRFDSGINAWRPNPATARDCAAGCTTNNSQFWAERSGVTTFSPWTLNSTVAPTASGSVITGRIVDDNGNAVAGAVVRLSGAQNRKFITDANGVYRFDNVATNGFYTVTPSRANYTFNPAFRSFSQLGDSTEAAFGATVATSNLLNPLDTPEYFVRQHYVDFLGREPDEAGFNFWSDQIISCGADTDCVARRRENASAAYFLSIEFQQTGGLVDGLYRASYGVRPDFAAFMPDVRTVGAGVVVGNEGWEATLQANKQAFVNSFVNRAAFHAAFDNLSNADYVATLIQHTGVAFTAAERDALVNGLNNQTMTRGDALRSIAENQRFVNAKFNETFVMMEYFGYLRRDPDASGFAFWLQKLNDFSGNFEQADMVKAFIVSGEFRDRFPR